MNFDKVLKGLTDAQRLAVETTEGPVLVIAGPGTGKTSLLTTRVANILKTTDTLPQNILCLTFTESGAQVMRDRLSKLIGQAAYDITISTYHGFGSDLIRRFPDYFAAARGQQPVDDLGTDALLRSIITELPHSSLLRYADTYVGDVKGFISDAKRALLTPDDIRAVATENLTFITAASPNVEAAFAGFKRVSKDTVGCFEELADTIEPTGQLGEQFMSELQTALEEYESGRRTPPLTKWKNAWLAKNADNQFIVDGARSAQKLHALGDIYEQYLQQLQEQELFDFDDMILQALQGLEANDDLKFTLQEHYQYLLLDEFQDTNAAQLRLVELLTDNPVHEGRPNVLAVGDDDQAIYAFQGADYSHMLQFYNLYRDTLVVPLTQNFRSHADILRLSESISTPIEERLHTKFEAIDKTLTASNKQLPKRAAVEYRSLKSEAAQFAWAARQIKQLVDGGMPAGEIAVLAPQHKYLEPLVAYLHEAGLPVRYEKRENILDDPVIILVSAMAQLVLALQRSAYDQASSLWPEILSHAMWQLPTATIWQLSWQASDHHQDWTTTLLGMPETKPIALFFIRLSQLAGTETLETMLDYLVGTTQLDILDESVPVYTSPLYNHFFEGTTIQQVGTYWDTLSNSIVLRARLREYKRADETPLLLNDLLEFIAAHRQANIKVLNTSPHVESSDAVELMTAYKAKGQEFRAVFVLACNNDVWGSGARNRSHLISLPPNLQHIRYAGSTDDERRRLFYVALTRAKEQLYLLRYQQSYAGRSYSPLRYLTAEEDQPAIIDMIDTEFDDSQAADPSALLVSYWQDQHHEALSQAATKALLLHRLQNFRLSPSHVNTFIDLLYGGPQTFFVTTLLRFPRAPTASSQFGNAIHETLETMHRAHQAGEPITEQRITASFENSIKRKRLSALDTRKLIERGTAALLAYWQQRSNIVTVSGEVEYNFRNENVRLGDVHFTGKIDKLIIDKTQKTITIVDYKTGNSYRKWTGSDLKLRLYKNQLYLYRYMVEHARTFQGYEVTGMQLEFVEPDDDDRINSLQIPFDEDEYQDTCDLAKAVWRHIMALDFPDTAEYQAGVKDTVRFEEDLKRD